MLKPLRILIGRCCAFGIENHQLGTWLFSQGYYFGQNTEKIGGAAAYVDMRFRIHSSRNALAQIALENEFDYIVFVDGDMDPDFRVRNPWIPADQQKDSREWAKPFIPSTLDFMLTNNVGAVGAPAVSGPPANKINVFVVDTEGPTDADGRWLEFRRMKAKDMAATAPQFLPVLGVGTGLMMIDVQVFRKLPKPWFEDLEEPDKTEVIQSQDFVFCKKLNQNGIPVYANLYSPARHIKFQGQDPPEPKWECEPCPVSQSAATTRTKPLPFAAA